MSSGPPTCSIQSRCGGCPTMLHTYEAQLSRKQMWLERSLKQSLDAVTPSPRMLGYRARIRLAADGTGRLGFHPPRSHEVIPIDECPIARSEINHCLAHVPVIHADVANVELRTNGEHVVVALDAPPRRVRGVEKWARDLGEEAFGGAAIALNGRTIRGETKVALTIADIPHRFSPATFYQVNLEVNQILVRDVVEAVRRRGPTRVLDVYAGAGNLSLPLASEGIDVIQIESHPNAVADGKATAKRLGLSVEVRRARAQDFRAGDAFFDLAIVDPPRAGAEGLMSQLMLTRPAAVVMVSCNPRTLARDVSVAREAGYQLVEAAMYDMFPQTEHVECMGVLERG